MKSIIPGKLYKASISGFSDNTGIACYDQKEKRIGNISSNDVFLCLSEKGKDLFITAMLSNGLIVKFDTFLLEFVEVARK